MKKLLSLILIFSILVCNFSVLAETDRQLDFKEQSQGLAKKDSDKNLASNGLRDALKTTFIAAAVLAVLVLSCYCAYKIGEKVAVNRQIAINKHIALANSDALDKNSKKLLLCVNKSKILKKILIGGAVAGTIAGTGLLLFLIYNPEIVMVSALYIWIVLLANFGHIH